MNRRSFLKMAGVVGLGVPVLAACQPLTRVDFGALGASGIANLHIPDGFTARRIATYNQAVLRHDGSSTGYTWHKDPDGGAVFPIVAGSTVTGWIYVSNSEHTPGGVGAIEFDSSGNIVDAYSILSGTVNNCAGGLMPFGTEWTWISCEETNRGLAYECNPYAPGNGVARPAMGRFNREAVAADPADLKIYQTEDYPTGAFYRFTPDTWGNLTSGLLEVMTEIPAGSGNIGWATVPDPSGSPTQCRSQVAGTKTFNGGEGVWWTDGNIFFTTKGDNRLWRYTPADNTLTVVYDDTAPFPAPRHLTGVDNVVATGMNRVFVAEDGGNMEIVGVDVNTGATYPIIRYDVSGSELTGPAFSPDGTRLYFSSQANPGETFEVTGPWNQN